MFALLFLTNSPGFEATMKTCHSRKEGRLHTSKPLPKGAHKKGWRKYHLPPKRVNCNPMSNDHPHGWRTEIPGGRWDTRVQAFGSMCLSVSTGSYGTHIVLSLGLFSVSLSLCASVKASDGLVFRRCPSDFLEASGDPTDANLDLQSCLSYIGHPLAT